MSSINLRQVARARDLVSTNVTPEPLLAPERLQECNVRVRFLSVLRRHDAYALNGKRLAFTVYPRWPTLQSLTRGLNP